MNVHVVLVRTESSGNLGQAARALTNMGADRLILIDPRCAIDETAHQMAAGAQRALEDATTYADWAAFFAREGEGLRLALTRRGGRQRKVSAFREVLTDVKTNREELQNLYLIFGPERNGLSDDDLAFVNFSCHLPVYGEMASLNLAQAVLLALFMLRDQFPPVSTPNQITGINAATVVPFYFPDQLIKEWLVAMGFNVEARKASAYLTLRRLFLQNQPTRHEVQVLESILQQNIRKLKAERSTEL